MTTQANPNVDTTYAEEQVIYKKTLLCVVPYITPKSPWPDINHVLCSRRQCLHKERSHQLQLQIRSLASKRTTPSDRQPSPRPQSPRSNKQPTTITATVAITRITNGDLPPQLTFSWPNNSQMIQRETSWQGQRCLEHLSKRFQSNAGRRVFTLKIYNGKRNL